ncbi:MAG: hypothetical protein LBD23_10080 [Oscillospiraceae bacterium]|jgi:radical SAM superfamily enzyme YgiQ (UPF0313 family)|nr:hypothetical protein [Oscillospiraceae bacterium]
MKVQLINSGNDNISIGNANSASYPPLGIISIASTIEKHFTNSIELNLIDGQIESLDNTIEKIRIFKPDILCISMYCTSIKYTMKCAEVGKEVQATVILGNDHAKTHYDTILLNSKNVDYISLDEFGERSMYYFIENKLNKQSCKEIPLTAYIKENGSIEKVKPPTGTNDEIWMNPLDYFPLPNRLLLDKKYWEAYLINFKKSYKSRILDLNMASGITTLNRFRGCFRHKHRCLYCSIGELRPCRSNKSYWDDIKAAQKQVNANMFYECCDNMLTFKADLKRLVATQPQSQNSFFLFYATTKGLDSEACSLFKELGTYCLNFGFDSGSDRALKLMKGKDCSVEMNKNAAELVTKSNMELHVSFILSGLGNKQESKKSFDDTYKLAKWLVNNTNTTTIECALLYPDRGAPLGSLIWNPSQYNKLQATGYDLSFINMEQILIMHDKYSKEIFIDPEKLVADFSVACGADINHMFEYQAKIRETCAENNIRFGTSRFGKNINGEV